jgi:hypothetical protein
MKLSTHLISGPSKRGQQFSDYTCNLLCSIFTQCKERKIRPSGCNHLPVFKTKGAMAASRGDKTLNGGVDYFDVQANQIEICKNQPLAKTV